MQDALGWYVGEAGTNAVQLAVLQQRLAADMEAGEVHRPCRCLPNTLSHSDR